MHKIFVVAATGALMSLANIGGDPCLANPFKHNVQKNTLAPDLSWEAESQLADQLFSVGRFDEAEKRYLDAMEKLKIDFKSAPPTSFANRYFPLRDNLRLLYLRRAEVEEESASFEKIQGYYKKALNMPGATEDVGEKYADFLTRHGKVKEAAKVIKEGKRRCLYWKDTD